MSSRHTRRKVSKAKALDKTLALALASRAKDISMTVRRNKSAPLRRDKQEIWERIEGTNLKKKVTIPAIERNFYPPCSMGNLSERASSARVCGHATGVIRKDNTVSGRWKG